MNDNPNERRPENRNHDDLMPDSLESADTGSREKPKQEDKIWTPFDLPLDSFRRREEARPQPVHEQPSQGPDEESAAVPELDPVEEPVAPRVPAQFRERENRISEELEGESGRAFEPPRRSSTFDVPGHVLAQDPDLTAETDDEIEEAHDLELKDEGLDAEPMPFDEPVLPEESDADESSVDEVEANQELQGLLASAEDTSHEPFPKEEQPVASSEVDEYRFPTAPLPPDVQAAIDRITGGNTTEAVDQSHDSSLDLEPSFRPADVSGISAKHGLAEDLSEAIDIEEGNAAPEAPTGDAVPEGTGAPATQENLTKDDIDLKGALEAEATGEVEAWQAEEKDDPTYDAMEGVPEHLRKPSDAERLRKRLDKYPESRGDKKQAFKLNLNRTSHRYGVVAVVVLAVVLIASIFGLVNRVQRQRSERLATIEKQVTSMKLSEGNVPSEQRVQHSDGQRIVNASIPLFGDAQIDQYTQAWAKSRIDEFEAQTSVLPASMPDKRPILALSHRSYILENELASIQLVAETYKNVDDLSKGTLQKVESEDILYDVTYRTFMSPTDIFMEGAPSTLASNGTRKIQSGEYRVIEALAAPALERQIEADKAQAEASFVTAPSNSVTPPSEGSVPQGESEVPANEGDAPQAFFGVKTLRAEEAAPAPVDGAIAEEGAAVDPAAGDEGAAVDPAGGEEGAPIDTPQENVETTASSSEIPRVTEGAEEETEASEPDTTYAAVILPETTILYKYLSFQPDGLVLELDPSLLPNTTQTVAIHYTYDEILDVLRVQRKADGGFQLNLRIDPLGDTQRQYTSRLLETLYGTGLEEQPIPAPTESSTEPSNPESTESQSADAQPVESDAASDVDAEDSVEAAPENSEADGEQASASGGQPALFGAKVLSAEDASPVQSESTDGQDAAAPEETSSVAATPETTNSEAAAPETTNPAAATPRSSVEPTISRSLNQAAAFPQGGLQLTEHFVNAKARYSHEIKYVALTFNNSPSSETSHALLDLFNSYRGHGTFFVRGATAAEETAGPLMKAMLEQGSELGNNAYNFYSFAVLSDAQIQAEINQTASLIEEKAGVRPRFVRPPFGDYDDRVLQAGGAPMVNWSFTSGDDWGATPDVIYETILEYIEPGAIIFSLDGNEDTVQALGRVLPELYGRGYRFTTLSELFAIYTEEGAQDGVLYTSVWN